MFLTMPLLSRGRIVEAWACTEKLAKKPDGRSTAAMSSASENLGYSGARTP
jgi:hypothetical protein